MQRELNLADYLAVLRRRWLLLALGLALGAAGAIGYSAQQTPLYRSSTSLLVGNDPSIDSLDSGRSAVDRRRLLQNEVQFIGSERVAAAAAEELGFTATVSAGAADNADLVVITAESRDAGQAAAIANAHAAAFIAERRARTVDGFLTTAEIVQGRIANVEAELDGLRFGDPRREALEAQRDVYVRSLEGLNLSADLSGGVDATVLRTAVAPEAPFQPRTTRNLVVGIGFGLLAGLASAFLREFLDDRIRSQQDLERVPGSIPMLAMVPRARRASRRARADLVSLDDPDSDAAEAYRTLRAALQFIAVGSDVRVVQVTSPGSGEGKTTTAANLAVALTRAGKKVVLVDGDLRRPRIHSLFDLEASPGLTDVLAGTVAAYDARHRPLDGEPLAVLSAGTGAPNPSELLGGESADMLFRQLGKAADLVIVDSAPVLPVSDALALARSVDGTILVVESKRTTGRDLAQALDRLERVDAQVIGAVLNQGDRRQSGRYEYAALRSVARRSRRGGRSGRDEGGRHGRAGTGGWRRGEEPDIDLGRTTGHRRRPRTLVG